MRKWIFILISVMALAACSDAETSINEELTEKVTAETEQKDVTITETSEETEAVEPETVESETKESELTPLTLEDFNNRYELDTEYSEPFIDGKFELKDSSIINADWYFYLEGTTFDYASCIFLDGQLVQAQLELKDDVTKEDVLTELGLSEVANYDLSEQTNIVDIVIDERFDDANISRLPNEWD